MAGAVFYFILFFFVIVRFLTNSGKQKGSGNTASRNRTARPSARGPMAADGHRVPKDQDISCERFGHKHQEFDTPRYIPHQDPEEGYIILNGVRMKLTEADSYENRI